jgi:hypothetical protein
MQQKTIIGVVIVVVLVIAGVAVWKVSMPNATKMPTATNTASSTSEVVATNSGWKVYQNNAEGLSFEYSSTLTIDKQDNDGYSMIHVIDPKSHAQYVSIMVVNDPSQPGTSDLFTGPYPKQTPTTSNGSMTVDQKTLNGLKGIEVYGTIQEGHSYSDEFIFKGTHLWEIYLDPVLEGRIDTYPEPGTPTPDKDTYEKILTSIKISS